MSKLSQFENNQIYFIISCEDPKALRFSHFLQEKIRIVGQTQNRNTMRKIRMIIILRPKQYKQKYNNQFLSNLFIQVSQNKQEGCDENQMMNYQIQRNRSEHINLISSFQHKMRLQQNEIEVLKQQVLLQQKCLASIPKENQLQIQQYEQEIEKLRQFLDEALQMPSEPKKNQLITYLSKIQELKTEQKYLKQNIENQQRDMQQLQNIIKKQQDYIQQNTDLIKSGKNQSEQKNDWNQVQQQYNQQLNEKERKIAELTEISGKMKTLQVKFNSQSQFIEQLNSQLMAKQNLMYILFLQSQKLENENEKFQEEIGYFQDQQKDQSALIDQLSAKIQDLQQQQKPVAHLSSTEVQTFFEYQKKSNLNQAISIALQTEKTQFSIQSIQQAQYNKRIFQIDFSNQYDNEFHSSKEVAVGYQSKEQLIEKNFTFDSQRNKNLEEKIIMSLYEDDQILIGQISKQYLQSFIDNYNQPNINYECKVQEGSSSIIDAIVAEYLNQFVNCEKTKDQLESEQQLLKEIVLNYLDSFVIYQS